MRPRSRRFAKRGGSDRTRMSNRSQTLFTALRAPGFGSNPCTFPLLSLTSVFATAIWDHPDLNQGQRHPRPQGYQATPWSRTHRWDPPRVKGFVASIHRYTFSRREAPKEGDAEHRHDGDNDLEQSASLRSRLTGRFASRSLSPRPLVFTRDLVIPSRRQYRRGAGPCVLHRGWRRPDRARGKSASRPGQAASVRGRR